MPAVSKKQQKFFGYLLSNPEERKKRGVSKKDAEDFAKEVKYKKIIRRHSEAGDKYIANVKYPPEDSWKKEFGEARKQLLKDFYDYCLTNRQLSWTDWLQLRQQSPVCQFTTTSIAGVAGTHQAVAQIRP